MVLSCPAISAWGSCCGLGREWSMPGTGFSWFLSDSVHLDKSHRMVSRCVSESCRPSGMHTCLTKSLSTGLVLLHSTNIESGVWTMSNKWVMLDSTRNQSQSMYAFPKLKADSEVQTSSADSLPVTCHASYPGTILIESWSLGSSGVPLCPSFRFLHRLSEFSQNSQNSELPSANTEDHCWMNLCVSVRPGIELSAAPQNTWKSMYKQWSSMILFIFVYDCIASLVLVHLPNSTDSNFQLKHSKRLKRYKQDRFACSRHESSPRCCAAALRESIWAVLCGFINGFMTLSYAFPLPFGTIWFIWEVERLDCACFDFRESHRLRK